MLDVEEIVLKLDPGFLLTGGVAVSDLSPSSNPWPHSVSKRVKWNCLAEGFGECRLFRPWADYAHLPAQNVPKLRQLVESRSTQESAYSSDPLVVMSRKL